MSDRIKNVEIEETSRAFYCRAIIWRCVLWSFLSSQTIEANQMNRFDCPTRLMKWIWWKRNGTETIFIPSFAASM